MERDQQAQELFGRVDEQAMEAEDYFLLGAGLVRQDRAEPALAVLEKARTLDPSHADALHELAPPLCAAGRLSDAVEVAAKLAALPGWEARGGVILGALRQERLDAAGAANALTRALKADPRLKGAVATPAAVRKLLARTLIQAGRADAAKHYLDAVLLDGPDAEASWLLSRAFLVYGDTARAAQLLAQAGGYATADPLRVEPAMYLGAKGCAGVPREHLPHPAKQPARARSSCRRT